ncbi:MAG: tetratricopeptide repeat protein [Spirochaetaceae bacterium]|jgi:tetratricopeptide (TPR) repeat protein|nr:tetratricopeptide repeat protein [Spirochaetaceae bacterium]
MPMRDPILTKAARLLKRGKFDAAIKVLEPEVNRYKGEFLFYYLLGLAYLRTKIFKFAHDYFKLAWEVRKRDPGVLLGLAVLYLRRGDTERAVDLYLEVQDVDEQNKTAKKALQVIRKYSGSPALSAWADSKKLFRLFPPAPSAPLRASDILGPFAGLLMLLACAGGVLVLMKVIPSPVTSRAERIGFSAAELDQKERDVPVQIEGSYRYVLTPKEVFGLYEEARDLFTKYRDEAAKVALNRLLESNASDPIKTKARLLISYMDIPGFDTLKDRFTYEDVIREPILYRDCYIIWQGMAANLEIGENTTTFNFLVGYDMKKSALQGVVPVGFNLSAAINPEKPLEVLGKVIPIAAEKGLEFKLEGLALHQSGLRLGGDK